MQDGPLEDKYHIETIKANLQRYPGGEAIVNTGAQQEAIGVFHDLTELGCGESGEGTVEF